MGLGDKNSLPQGDLFGPVDDEESDHHMVTHLGTQRSAFRCPHVADCCLRLVSRTTEGDDSVTLQGSREDTVQGGNAGS